VIVADPPWSFGDKLTMSDVKRGAESHYATLSLDDLRALPVGACADTDAVLVLWRPSSLAREALSLMDAWGFRQTQEIVWYKVSAEDVAAFGMGRLFRASKEVAFVGVNGSPYGNLRNRSIRDVFAHPRLPHSAKPETVQDALETMFPDGERLELFARRQRDRWTCIGNEAPSTLGLDVRDVLPTVAARIRDAASPLLRSPA
jgi:N6-adenosine-specific RNA methylase IME4